MKAPIIILITTFIFTLAGSTYSQVSKDKRYINGFLYTESFTGTVGHPFFLSESWYRSSLSMDGRQYEGINLRYDLYRDQILFNHIHRSGSYIVVLNKTLIEGFVIEGHQFRKLPQETHFSGGMKEGYYELLSEGKATFYVKWQKRLSDPSPDSQGEFSLFSEWYILNNGEVRKVSGKSGLLKALDDHKKEIKSFIRDNGMVINSGKELEVKRIIDYYNHLEP